VPNPSRPRKVEERRTSANPRYDGLNRRFSSEGEEHETRLSTKGDHVPRTVVFLVLPGPFVLLDDAAVVLIERETASDSSL
jgi:hypothetical protein